MKNKQKTVDEYIQILLDKNGYISKHIPIELIPEGHPAWQRYHHKISEAEYEETLQETDEVLEIYIYLHLLFKVLSYYDFSEEYRMRIVNYYEKQISSDTNIVNTIKAYSELGYWCGAIYPEDKAIKYFDTAINLCKQNSKISVTNLADVYINKGDYVKEYCSENDKALKYYEKALKLYMSCARSDKDIKIAEIYLNIAEAIYDDEFQSKKYCEKALDMLPEEHEMRGSVYNALGGIYFGKDSPKAFNCHKKSLDYAMPVWDLIVTYVNIADSANRARKFDEAIYYYERGIELCNKVCSFNSTDNYSYISNVYWSMSHTYDYGFGDYDKAKYFYEKVIEHNKCCLRKKYVYDICFDDYCGMAELSMKYEKYNDALKIYNVLIRHLKNKKYSTVDDIENIYRFYTRKAEIYSEKYNFSASASNSKKAVYYLNEYIKLIKENDNWEKSRLYRELAKLYYKIDGCTDECEKAAKKAIYYINKHIKKLENDKDDLTTLLISDYAYLSDIYYGLLTDRAKGDEATQKAIYYINKKIKQLEKEETYGDFRGLLSNYRQLASMYQDLLYSVQGVDETKEKEYQTKIDEAMTKAKEYDRILRELEE